MIKHALTLAAVALFVNLPMLVAYLWRARHKGTNPLTLGFEGPVLCNIAALLVTWIPPFPCVILVAPWLLHIGTWIAVGRLAARFMPRRPRR